MRLLKKQYIPVDLARGMALRCREAGAAIVGGDLSAGEGLVVAVTASAGGRGFAGD